MLASNTTSLPLYVRSPRTTQRCSSSRWSLVCSSCASWAFYKIFTPHVKRILSHTLQEQTSPLHTKYSPDGRLLESSYNFTTKADAFFWHCRRNSFLDWYAIILKFCLVYFIIETRSATYITINNFCVILALNWLNHHRFGVIYLLLPTRSP